MVAFYRSLLAFLCAALAAIMLWKGFTVYAQLIASHTRSSPGGSFIAIGKGGFIVALAVLVSFAAVKGAWALLPRRPAEKKDRQPNALVRVYASVFSVLAIVLVGGLVFKGCDYVLNTKFTETDRVPVAFWSLFLGVVLTSAVLTPIYDHRRRKRIREEGERAMPQPRR